MIIYCLFINHSTDPSYGQFHGNNFSTPEQVPRQGQFHAKVISMQDHFHAKVRSFKLKGHLLLAMVRYASRLSKQNVSSMPRPVPCQSQFQAKISSTPRSVTRHDQWNTSCPSEHFGLPRILGVFLLTCWVTSHDWIINSSKKFRLKD